MSVIHWYKPAAGEYGADRRYEVRVSIHDSDDVRDIAWRMIEKVRSQGHEVREVGGNYTGPDGSPIGLWFDVIVTHDGHKPMTWEHAVCLPSELWPLAERASVTTEDRA